ncbi:MAG: hypothetical protein Q8J71_07610 [Brevundimonas sp.]|nr:hypothetical protein [Brevundimonas sp.]
MTDMTVKTPWHLWVVGIIALLWNGYGCVDYTMTQLQGDAWLQSMKMTEAQIAYFNAMPAWTHGAWAIGVWGGLLGSVLLLLRMKWAFHFFVASLLGLVASLIYQYGMSNGMEVGGTSSVVMYGVILAACLFFIWYAWTMGRKRVLR